MNERIFYVDDAWDLEVNTKTFGWLECCGIHDRSDYDLNQHAKKSKTDLRCQYESKGCKESLHVLELAFGVDRPFFALVDQNFIDDENRGNIVLKVKKNLAPVKIAVLPLVNKLHGKATEIYKELVDDNEEVNFKITYDKSGSIGKRYARNDEIGTPYCVTVDFDTVEKDDSVTIRDRDSTEQKRVKVSELLVTVKKLIKGKINFSDL
jgi:glycyl-tRNA synthetase